MPNTVKRSLKVKKGDKYFAMEVCYVIYCFLKAKGGGNTIKAFLKALLFEQGKWTLRNSEHDCILFVISFSKTLQNVGISDFGL